MTSPVTARGKLKRIALIAIAVLVLAVCWHQVFAMTGLLWWAAPQEQQTVARPEAPTITEPDKDWVDVDTYLRTHSVWNG